MKGGARLRVHLEGWCETSHDLDEGCLQIGLRLDLLRLDLDEGWLQIALEWLHDVAWAMFWGGRRSTKPCVFPCKVAAAGDERYLVCAAGAAGVGWSVFFCRSVTVA